MTSQHTLDAEQVLLLTEACRAKDRLDKLDQILRGEEATWARTDDYELRIDAPLPLANATANLIKQLLAALRLPDENGRRPRRRGTRRGVYVLGGR